jgi:hypothetical protein
MPPVLFALVILEIESCFLPNPARSVTLLFYTFHHYWDDRCQTFLCWDGVSQTFCPDWPWTMILPTSASQVDWIARVSHRHLARNLDSLCLKCLHSINIETPFPFSSFALTWLGPRQCMGRHRQSWIYLPLCYPIFLCNKNILSEAKRQWFVIYGFLSPNYK